VLTSSVVDSLYNRQIQLVNITAAIADTQCDDIDDECEDECDNDESNSTGDHSEGVKNDDDVVVTEQQNDENVSTDHSVDC